MKILYILPLIALLSCKDSQQQQPEVKPVLDTIQAIKDDHNHGMEGRVHEFETKYTFDSFKAELYNGKLQTPVFTNDLVVNDPELVKLIKEGCKGGINFGGKYTLIHEGCGAMCERIFVVDRTNGQIYDTKEPRDGKYGYIYKKDSRLLIANSEVFEDESMTSYNDLYASPEVYVWEGTDFKFLQ